jgi:lactate racemase-like protein
MAGYPQFFRVRQTFDAPRVDDVEGEVGRQLGGLGLERSIRPGESVAITAGSRGITNIARIIQAAVKYFQGLGAKPFIVPAMGSHGGGTPEGQRAVIEAYGVTEAFCGCPIRATMQTVIVCQTAEGFPVHFDRLASEADHVLVCGRVKPHTDFIGDIESGLMKMMLIGLGKHEGAKVYHRAIHDYSFGQIVRSVGRRVLEACPIRAGLAIIENGYDETAQIAGVLPEQFEAREKELLVIARRLLPRLPFEQIDLLIIDEIGKNISGTGMDTNVIGRKHNDHEAAVDEFPKVRRIFVRELTKETQGNATGIGLAEFCTSRLLEQMDVEKTRINCLTAGHISAAMLPMDFATDRDVLDAALPTIGLREPHEARVVWIRNTLDVREVECSAAYLAQARERSDLEVLTPLRDLRFRPDGSLPLIGELAN